MRVEVRCPICSNDRSRQEPPYDIYSRFITVCDRGIYEFECPKGHRAITVSSSPKHEILFRIATNALLDGYLRDSISSFAASLERFYEFAIRIICKARTSNEISQESFNKFWKRNLKQSERQLGAFAILWLAEMSELPNLLPQTQVELRNDVVHNGMIPTYDDCIIYGQAVIDVISPLQRRLIKDYPEIYKRECFVPVELARREYNQRLAILQFEPYVREEDSDNINFKSYLDDMRTLREIQGIPSVSSENFRIITVYPVQQELTD
jgi:hypothetical protein